MNWLIWWHIAWIVWYDDTSHELVYMMTHRMNWLIWWHIAWTGLYDDTTHELVDVIYRVNLAICWYILWIWRCDDTWHQFGDVRFTHHSRRVSQFPAYMYKMLNTGTNQVPPSIGPWWEPSIPSASPNILQPAVSVTCSQEPTSSRPPLFSQPH